MWTSTDPTPRIVSELEGKKVTNIGISLTHIAAITGILISLYALLSSASRLLFILSVLKSTISLLLTIIYQKVVDCTCGG